MFPIFYENSRVPKWVGKFSPIDPYALSFGIWVWCKGSLSPRIKRHEIIHYKQQVEMLFIGQWLLYVSFYLFLRIKLRSGVDAYRNNPFEVEAYSNDRDEDYLDNRKPFAWVNYVRQSLAGADQDDF